MGNGRVALERLARKLGARNETLIDTLMPLSDEQLVSEITANIDKQASELRTELAVLAAEVPRLRGALAEALEGAGEVPGLREAVAQARAEAAELPGLREALGRALAEAAKLRAQCEEVGRRAAGCELASEDVLAALNEAKSALGDAKSAATKAQARAFAAEMRGSSGKAAPAGASADKMQTTPFAVELNMTKTRLEKARAEAAGALQERQEALQRGARLAAALRLEEERSKKLSGALKEIGGLVGVGGFGGFLSLVMSDEDIISDTKVKIALLKREKAS